MLLAADRSVLVVVDVQERLAPVIHGGEAAIDNIRTLVEAARALDVPVVVTEQYPRGLGPTVTSIASLIEPEEIVEKIEFSAASNPLFMKRMERLGRGQVVVCGMEAHICVLQTALGLTRDGVSTYLVRDASASRAPANAETALLRARASGIHPVTTEMVVFEWLARADVPAFKNLMKRIK
ncbi:MAG TPA: hydrolase [Alphaproteobacteria bacterium]|nr:hydrolase [Alphaproteobacteria bacterium]